MFTELFVGLEQLDEHKEIEMHATANHQKDAVTYSYNTKESFPNYIVRQYTYTLTLIEALTRQLESRAITIFLVSFPVILNVKPCWVVESLLITSSFRIRS
ncbi:hypothetical protein TNCT_451611 [Trichonephila clavata]|uniref:Uncharacterized protein n=1 Tax=Trichonephila clavata TaxID=2740835 RepID=A0A8X6FG94_TRICU|nr:hypothetical protein TNCT_451611 [Trichonephila clavata]